MSSHTLSPPSHKLAFPHFSSTSGFYSYMLNIQGWVHLELLVDPRSHVGPVLSQAFRKPKTNLSLGAVYAVTSMNDVAANINGILSTDGPRVCCKGVCGTCTNSVSLNVANPVDFRAAKHNEDRYGT